MDREDIILRKVYGDILLGYTKSEVIGQVAYIRHLSPLEQAEIDGEYVFLYDRAVENGLIPEEDKLKSLYKLEVWSEEDEKFIENQTTYLENLKVTKKNLLYEAQINDLNRQIEEVGKGVAERRTKRAGLLGVTVESYCSKKLSEVYILKSIYKDKNFSIPLYQNDEFDELDDNELGYVMDAYNNSLELFTEKGFKRIALMNNVQNHFSLCDDNLYNFFGKPIVQLTFFQCEVARYARFFRHILSGEKSPPSDELLKDPDKLIDWYHQGENVAKMLANNGGRGVTSAVGASAEDLKKMAGDGGEVVSFAQVAAKEGKTKLNREDLMKILG